MVLTRKANITTMASAKTPPIKIKQHDLVGKLRCSKAGTICSDEIICLALAHNESQILHQFFDHYRNMGVEKFLIVDDHSSDGTNTILETASDVAIFKPVEGSTYSADKVAWRCDLLDKFADNRWVLLPDIDEHLVYPDMNENSIEALADKLDNDQSQALFTIMIDMYDDRPLKDHVFRNGNLVDAFPYFDSPREPVCSYRIQPPAKSFLKRFPTPPVHVYGGLRERQFFKNVTRAPGALTTRLLNKFANLARPISPGFLNRLANALTRFSSKRIFPDKPFSLTKLGMIKWQKGMKLSGGPHAVSRNLQLASTTAAFLHFKFTKGVKGLEYTAKRGQHAGGGEYYQQMLDQRELLSASPYSKFSTQYEDPQTLIDCGLIRK